MKKIALLIASLVVLASCEREIPTVDPSALDNRNIYVRMYKYWNGGVLDKSKVLEINGSKIKIDHIYLTMSKFRYVSADGMVEQKTESDLTSLDVLSTSTVKLGYLPAGNYNGTLHYRVGLDSARTYTPPSQLETSNPLSTGDVWGGSDLGHSYFQIEGGIFDPADTVMTTPSQNFIWRVGTVGLRMDFEDKRNFNVPASNDVFFVVNLDVEKLFLGLSPTLTPVINSDPSDNTDMSLAQVLRNNIQSELVFEP